MKGKATIFGKPPGRCSNSQTRTRALGSAAVLDGVLYVAAGRPHDLSSAEAYDPAHDRWTARTKDGRLSAQWEHTVLCTDTGVEVLT